MRTASLRNAGAVAVYERQRTRRPPKRCLARQPSKARSKLSRRHNAERCSRTATRRKLQRQSTIRKLQLAATRRRGYALPCHATKQLGVLFAIAQLKRSTEQIAACVWANHTRTRPCERSMLRGGGVLRAPGMHAMPGKIPRRQRKPHSAAPAQRAIQTRHVHIKFRGSIVVSISACHAEDPGSIPGRGVCQQTICDVSALSAGNACAPARHYFACRRARTRVECDCAYQRSAPASRHSALRSPYQREAMCSTRIQTCADRRNTARPSAHWHVLWKPHRLHQ